MVHSGFIFCDSVLEGVGRVEEYAKEQSTMYLKTYLVFKHRKEKSYINTILTPHKFEELKFTNYLPSE